MNSDRLHNRGRTRFPRLVDQLLEFLPPTLGFEKNARTASLTFLAIVERCNQLLSLGKAELAIDQPIEYRVVVIV